jgi:hypothetical protein
VSAKVRSCTSTRLFVLAVFLRMCCGCSSSSPTPTTPTSNPSSTTVTVSPSTASVQVSGGAQQFTATVTTTQQNQNVSWALAGSGCSGASCGALSATSSASGVAITYTAPASVPTPATVMLTATSAASSSSSAQATITLTSVPVPPSTNIAVTVSPKRGGIAISQVLPVTATVQNDNANAGVTWSVSGTTASGSACSGSACGTFTNVTTTTASYVAPPTAGVYSITATSITDTTKSASSSIGATDLSGVLTYHNNLSRDGTNTHEFALTTSNVTTAIFGKLFSCPVDGAIYVQPLWIPQLKLGGAPHNVVVVATQHDSLYAFDADASPCVTLWQASLIDSAHGGTAGETPVPSSGANALVGMGDGDITPEVGVTGTPVIDPTTNTLYVVSKSVNSTPQFFQRLHAIDLTTGNERMTPKSLDSTITVPGNAGDSVNGQVAFNPGPENQRPGLVLYNGVVYVAWAAHEDADPWHGWLIGFSTATLGIVAVFNTTPNTVNTLSYGRGGIWMGGGAPAIDSSGNLYCITGNGTFDANTGGSNYGDTILKFSTANGLVVADYFTPLDQATRDANDTDFGSGAATILVDQPSSPVPHMVIGGGKDGNMFVLNRDSLGGFSSSTNKVVQTINIGGRIFATPVFWQNNFYVAGVGPMQQFVLNVSTGQFGGTAASQSANNFGFPGSTASLSASGTSNAILWALDNTNYCTPLSPGCGPTVLHAYNPGNLATEYWNSTQAASNRDQAGNAVKFTVPTVANGKVYVPTRGNNTGGAGSSTTVAGELDVYGLLPN